MTSRSAPRSSGGRRLRPVPALPLLGFAAAYALAVLLGRATRLEGGQLALVWPAAAVGVVWLTHAWGRGRLPLHLGVLAAVAVLVYRLTGASDLLALGLGTANAVQAVVTAGLLRAWQPEPGRLRTTRDLGALALACVAGAGAGSLAGGVLLWQLAGDELLPTVLAWVLRTCSSCLVLGAFALRVRDRATDTAAPRATAGPCETAVGVGLVVAGYGLAFASAEALPVEFLLLPLSMWVALRLRTTSAATSVVLIGLAVVVLTAAGRGPFAPEDAALRVLLAQAFVTVVALVVLVLALNADERASLVARVREEQARSSAQAATLETVLDTVDVAIVACDAAGAVTLANRTARALQLDVAPAAGGPPAALFGADGTTPLRAHQLPLAQVLRDGHVSEPLVTVVPGSAPPVTVSCVGRALRDDEGRPLGAVVVHTDVTALRASEQQFRATFDHGPTPMARLAEDGTVVQANAAMRRFLALPSRRLVGAELAALAVPEDRARLRQVVAERSGRVPVEVRLCRPDGAAVWCEVTAAVVRAPDGQALVLVQVLDVHDRKAHQLALEDVAHRDALTGLDNRHVLDQRLAELLRSRGTSVVLAYLDLDGFKQINDTHGHEAGDAVLRATGQRLLALVRSGDVAVRLGGDEFVLACPVASGAGAVAFTRGLVERVEAALRTPVPHAGTSLSVGVSVGTALAAPGSDAASVLREADLAMYAAKRARKLRDGGAPRVVPAPTPPDEPQRLRALDASGALDLPPVQALDDLVRAAALIAGVPTALVTLVDEDTQRFAASCGVSVGGTSRDVSFCGHVVASDAELHVEDARRDPRFADNPLVTGELAVRSYAGFPLRTATGFVLGSLCVIGDVPGTLDEPRRAVLRLLATQATALLGRTPPEIASAPQPSAVPVQRALASV